MILPGFSFGRAARAAQRDVLVAPDAPGRRAHAVRAEGEGPGPLAADGRAGLHGGGRPQIRGDRHPSGCPDPGHRRGSGLP